MMLDKSQINEWDGEPEGDAKSEPAAAKPVASAKPPAIDADRPGIDPVFESSEAVPTGERVKLTPEQEKARRRRGQWLALGLFAFVILLFVLTMTKIGGRIVNWDGAFIPEKGAPIE